jgi:hypothetical protein
MGVLLSHYDLCHLFETVSVVVHILRNLKNK